MANGYSIPPKLSGLSHCTFSDCGLPARSRGLCQRHYHKWRKYGDPSMGGPPLGRTKEFLKETISNHQSGCVTWPFATSRGYAYMMWKGRYQSVSRLVLKLTVGEPPSPDMEAAHKCGQGSAGCISPDCLYWATKQQNLNDKERHGTIPRGEMSGMSKLTLTEVLAIREDTRKGTIIAAEYDISRAQVSRIRSGKTWSHLNE